MVSAILFFFFFENFINFSMKVFFEFFPFEEKQREKLIVLFVIRLQCSTKLKFPFCFPILFHTFLEILSCFRFRFDRCRKR